MKHDKLTTDELIERAEQLEESGMLNDALELWRAATQREADPVVLCEFGLLATRLGNWAEAEHALKTAMELAPGMSHPSALLGSLYIDQAKPERAIEYLEQSLKLERRAPTFTQLGVAQLELGLIELAQKSLEAALALDPNYEEAYYNLGLLHRDERPSKAVELFGRALELDPEYGIAHRELGWVLIGLENREREAEYHLRTAITLNSDDGWAHIYLGNILWRRGDVELAEQAFKRAVFAWPDIAVPYWCLGLFYEYHGRNEEADKSYQEGINIEPDDPQANKLFGVYLKQIGQSAKAKVYLERAHALSPDDRTISVALASLN